MTKEEQIEMIKKDPFSIQNMDNPDEELKTLAISIYGSAIDYVKNPSDELKMIAIKQDPYSIQYIKSPNAQIKLEAFVSYLEKNKTEIIIRKKGVWKAYRLKHLTS